MVFAQQGGAAIQSDRTRIHIDARSVYTVALLVWCVESIAFLVGPIGPLVNDMASYWSAGTTDIHLHTLDVLWPPLYPLLTVPFHLWGGPAALVAVQTVVVSLAVLGVAWYLRVHAGTGVAELFLASMAACPVLLVYARFVLSDSWFVLLTFAWIMLAEHSEHTGSDWYSFLGGVCLGLGAAIRPEAVAVAAIAVLWLLLQHRWVAAVCTMLPVLGEAAALAVWTRLTTGIWIASQQRFWETLWQGNNPKAIGFYVKVQRASPSRYRALFLTWLQAHPIRFLELCGARLVEFWFAAAQFIQVLAVNAHILPFVWLVYSHAVTEVTSVVFFVALLWLFRAGHLRDIVWPLIAVLGNWWFCVPFLFGGRFHEDALPFVFVITAVAWGRLRSTTGVSAATGRTSAPRQFGLGG